MHNPKAVVFDLGGVLLRLRNPIELFGLRMSETQFFERWLLSPSVREFERGAVDAPEFANNVALEMHLPMSGREFLERFDAWPECLFPDPRNVDAAWRFGMRSFVARCPTDARMVIQDMRTRQPQ